MNVVFKKVWGFLVCECDPKGIDILPRVSFSLITNAFIIKAGFLMFSASLTLWDKQMRGWLRRTGV